MQAIALRLKLFLANTLSKVAGKVRLRDAATVNPNLTTGEIEVVAADLEVLNAAKTPPFYIQDDIDTDENLRLKYRYLVTSSGNAENLIFAS